MQRNGMTDDDICYVDHCFRRWFGVGLRGRNIQDIAALTREHGIERRMDPETGRVIKMLYPDYLDPVPTMEGYIRWEAFERNRKANKKPV